ncbi:MAG: ester cyclase [Chloroflexaceae bacterium]
MTPQENNAIAMRFFDSAWNKGEFHEELLAPDALDHSTVGGQKKVERGSGSFRQIVGMFRSAMPDIKLTVEDEIYTDDKVVHRWMLNGTDTGGVMGMPPSGKQLTLTGTTIVRMQDGKIVERWANVDELGLLQQLGVVPPPPGAAEPVA